MYSSNVHKVVSGRPYSAHVYPSDQIKMSSNYHQLYNDQANGPHFAMTDQLDKKVSNNDQLSSSGSCMTPMFIAASIARYNKAGLKYLLIDEQGPAHAKVFSVKLIIGLEEFIGTGSSIKKAQQNAASLALENTTLNRPPVRQKRPDVSNNHDAVPTVELNQLVMKRGEWTEYTIVSYNHPVDVDQSDPSVTQKRISKNNYPRYCVSLKIGIREFSGSGPTLKAAKNNAASRALIILKNLPSPPQANQKKDAINFEQLKISDGPPIKSSITYLFEMAHKQKVELKFEVVDEGGPGHNKMYRVRCSYGSIVCEEEGQSKQLAKAAAANKVLATLHQSGIYLPQTKTMCKPKRTKYLCKEFRCKPDYGVDVHPVTRLLQVMQHKKKADPTFSVVYHSFADKKCEIQVTCDGLTCSGVGQNKKVAKKHAAEQMLYHLGIYTSPVQSHPPVTVLQRNPISK